ATKVTVARMLNTFALPGTGVAAATSSDDVRFPARSIPVMLREPGLNEQLGGRRIGSSGHRIIGSSASAQSGFQMARWPDLPMNRSSPCLRVSVVGLRL